jgi:hypothetical protein
MSGQAYGLKTEMYVGCYEKLNVLNSFYGGMGAMIRIENGTALSGNIYDGFKLGLFLPDFYKHPLKSGLNYQFQIQRWFLKSCWFQILKPDFRFLIRTRN